MTVVALTIGFFAALQFQQWLHARERRALLDRHQRYLVSRDEREQTLLDRIQAPERVVEQRMVPTVENLPQAVHPDDDLDYWLKQGIDRPEINIEVPS